MFDVALRDDRCVIGRGFVVLLAALGTMFALPLLAAPSDTHEWSNCPPRVLSQFYSHFTEFVPAPFADTDRHAGRRNELNWCGERARPAALLGDGLFLGGCAPLAVAVWIDVRRRRPKTAIVLDDR